MQDRIRVTNAAVLLSGQFLVPLEMLQPRRSVTRYAPFPQVAMKAFTSNGSECSHNRDICIIMGRIVKLSGRLKSCPKMLILLLQRDRVISPVRQRTRII